MFRRLKRALPTGNSKVFNEDEELQITGTNETSHKKGGVHAK